MTRDEILKCLGRSPDQIGEELVAFSESAKILSSEQHRLVNTHSDEWVGVFQGCVKAHDADFDTLMSKLAESGVPASKTIVRFIDRKEKTFIL